MSLKWIRDTYGVPAKAGERVEFTGNGKTETGTIISSSGGYLRVDFGTRNRRKVLCHPTWAIKYIGRPDSREMW